MENKRSEFDRAGFVGSDEEPLWIETGYRSVVEPDGEDVVRGGIVNEASERSASFDGRPALGNIVFGDEHHYSEGFKPVHRCEAFCPAESPESGRLVRVIEDGRARIEKAAVDDLDVAALLRCEAECDINRHPAGTLAHEASVAFAVVPDESCM